MDPRRAVMPPRSGAAPGSAADSGNLLLLRIRTSNGEWRQAEHQTDDASRDRTACQIGGQLKAKRYCIGIAAHQPSAEAALRGGHEQDRTDVTGPPPSPPPRTTDCVSHRKPSAEHRG